jgi:hypothetical protein
LLLVKAVQAGHEAQVDLDDLVVRAEWPSTGEEPPRYWRTGDFRTSLLEVGIHPRTGGLVSLTLVLAKELLESGPDASKLEDIATSVVQGVPEFDVSSWAPNGQFLDEKRDLRVFVGNDRLSIECDHRPPRVRCIQSGRVLFGVNETGTCYAVQIAGLSDQEMRAIRSMYAG